MRPTATSTAARARRTTSSPIPDWADTLVHLYSFSKAYRLTGHRVGAAVASPARLAEVEKFLDTVAICPNQLGQRAALWGMRNLGQWLAGERAEILDRRAAIIEGFPRLPGWRLLGCGAYFAYVEHPFELPSDQLAQRLVRDAGVLMLPGTMFQPEGDPAGRRQLRIAFANIDRAGVGQLFDRLAAADNLTACPPARESLHTPTRSRGAHPREGRTCPHGEAKAATRSSAG